VNLALSGIKVVVTRAADSAAALTRLLVAQGADVIEVPLIKTTPPSDQAALATSLQAIGEGDIVAVTSVPAARALLDHAPSSPARGVVVAAVGPATAEVLDGSRWRASIVPSVHTGRALAEEIGAPRGSGRVVYPAAVAPGPDFAESLAEMGWTVDHIEAYRTRHVVPPGAMITNAATADVITFTSGSTVQAWVAVVGDLGTPTVVSIGPSTTATAIGVGLDVAAEAEQQTLSGLVSAVFGVVS